MVDIFPWFVILYLRADNGADSVVWFPPRQAPCCAPGSNTAQVAEHVFALFVPSFCELQLNPFQALQNYL
jgi:hypothetical protein